jgi:hypothetical protein
MSAVFHRRWRKVKLCHHGKVPGFGDPSIEGGMNAFKYGTNRIWRM